MSHETRDDDNESGETIYDILIYAIEYERYNKKSKNRINLSRVMAIKEYCKNRIPEERIKEVKIQIKANEFKIVKIHYYTSYELVKCLYYLHEYQLEIQRKGKLVIDYIKKNRHNDVQVISRWLHENHVEMVILKNYWRYVREHNDELPEYNEDVLAGQFDMKIKQYKARLVENMHDMAIEDEEIRKEIEESLNDSSRKD